MTSTVTFGGTGGSAFTSYNTTVYSGPIGLPGPGRTMANGNTACLLRLVSVNQTNATSLDLAGSNGSNWVGVNGGSVNLVLGHANTSRMTFGRGGGGTTTDGHTNFTGTIGGSYEYGQAPSAPTLNSLTSTATGSLSYNFSGSTDNGGFAISTYRVEYATNSGFASSSYVETTSGTGTITGLVPSQTYYSRVAARTFLTDTFSTLGPYSAVQSAQVLGGVRVGIAGVWTDCAVYTGINGEWVPVQVFAGRAGAWVGLTS